MRREFDASGGVKSLGRRLLQQAIQASSIATIASLCKCHPSTISRLASGKQTSDSYSLRLALERSFGVPMGSWEMSDETHAVERAHAHAAR